MTENNFIPYIFPIDLKRSIHILQSYRVCIEENIHYCEKRTLLSEKERLYFKVMQDCIFTYADLIKVKNLFDLVKGTYCSFLFRNPIDYKSSDLDEAITSDDQAMVQKHPNDKRNFILRKKYSFKGNAEFCKIMYPRKNTIRVSYDGEEVEKNRYHFSFHEKCVIFNFDIEDSERLKAGFEYDIPVRFGEDNLNIILENKYSGRFQNLSLIKVNGDNA